MNANRAELPTVGSVVTQFGLRARHKLGQHFILDQSLCDRVARAAAPLANVIEVGPGPGGLTRALLDQGAARVIAIERDQRCIEALKPLAAVYRGRLEILEADALEIDAGALFEGERAKIVANLPYNVGTPLLLKWLGQAHRFEAMVLMFQKEVAERLVAPPGSRAYGRLSVKAQWLCHCEKLFTVGASAFSPPPKVASAVVRLTPREAPLAPADDEVLTRVTAAAFGQRRKMLRAALKSLGTDPAPFLEAAGIPGTARAETLRIEEFCALARLYATRASSEK